MFGRPGLCVGVRSWETANGRRTRSVLAPRESRFREICVLHLCTREMRRKDIRVRGGGKLDKNKNYRAFRLVRAVFATNPTGCAVALRRGPSPPRQTTEPPTPPPTGLPELSPRTGGNIRVRHRCARLIVYHDKSFVVIRVNSDFSLCERAFQCFCLVAVRYRRHRYFTVVVF